MLDAGFWDKKINSNSVLQANSTYDELHPVLEYQPETKTIIVKKFASAFFGTDLSTQLVSKGIDKVIVTRFTTSGCIRPTDVDDCQYDFRTIVALEAVGDRAKEPLLANLFDMDSK